MQRKFKLLITGLGDIDELGEMPDDNVDGTDSDETRAIPIIESDEEPESSQREEEKQVEDLTTPTHSVLEVEKIEDWQQRMKIFDYDQEKRRIINMCTAKMS